LREGFNGIMSSIDDDFYQSGGSMNKQPALPDISTEVLVIGGGNAALTVAMKTLGELHEHITKKDNHCATGH